MHKINVSLVYARKEQQWLYEAVVPRGTTVLELIKESCFKQQIPELEQQEIEDLSVGVYAQKITLDYLLQEGDRVEIYRPLQADPKEVRRQLALLGKTIGKRK